MAVLNAHANVANGGMNMRQLAGIANTPEPRLARARRIAAEVRARHPEMQVRRIAP
jgi:hypothetical protein